MDVVGGESTKIEPNDITLVQQLYKALLSLQVTNFTINLTKVKSSVVISHKYQCPL